MIGFEWYDLFLKGQFKCRTITEQNMQRQKKISCKKHKNVAFQLFYKRFVWNDVKESLAELISIFKI